MTHQEVEAILRKIADDTYRKGDLDAVYQYYSDDIVFRRAPFPAVVGKEANRKSDADMLAASTENQLTIHGIVVEGDTAAMHYTWQAVHSGVSPSLGIPPTGKQVKASGCMIYHWKDGKIVEQWDYTDMLSLLQQLGVIPAFR